MKRKVLIIFTLVVAMLSLADQRGLRKRSDQGRALLITFLSYNHLCSINNRENIWMIQN